MSNTLGARDNGGPDPMSEYMNGGNPPSQEESDAFFIKLSKANEQEINALLTGEPLKIQKGTLTQVHNVLPLEDIPQTPQTENNLRRNFKPGIEELDGDR